MASQVITGSGKNLLLNRLYNASPASANVQVFMVGTGTGAAVDTDEALEEPITGWNAGGDTKDFVSGYPQFDTVNKQVTTRGFISSTQCNGYDIAEVGEFNAVTGTACFSRDVFSPIAKTNQQEMAFIWVHKT